MSEKNIYQRINAVMMEVEGVKKGIKVEFSSGSYRAVGHDDVTYLLHMPVAKAGIVIVPNVIESKMEILEKVKEYKGQQTITKEYMASITIELTAVNVDRPEEKISVRMPAIAFDSSDKAFGKAISMANKYGLLKLFMLDSYDDEENRNEPKQSKPANKVNAASKPSSEGVGDYIPKVGIYKGIKISSVNTKDLTEYCTSLKKNPDLNGPLLEFVNKSREYLTGKKQKVETEVTA